MNTGAAILLSLVAFFLGVAVTTALVAGFFHVADKIERHWRK